MIPFNQDELDGLTESLRDQPGFITAAVVPSGAGDVLLERLRQDLQQLKFVIAARDERPLHLGEQATQLGQRPDDHVFVLRVDDIHAFASEAEAIRFWQEINYQREALASGTVRTFFILSEKSSRELALLADDLWSWVTIFRFPEAVRIEVQAVDADLLGQEGSSQITNENLALLRSQQRRAIRAGLPRPTLVENYSVPLFLALTEAQGTEALDLWKNELRSEDEVHELPPQTSLLVAQKMVLVARWQEGEPHREELVLSALVMTDRAVTSLAPEVERLEVFEPGLLTALSIAVDVYQKTGRFDRALKQVERCLILVQDTDGAAAVAEKLQQRRMALELLIKAEESHALSLSERIEGLQDQDESGLTAGSRSRALGTALEISIKLSDVLLPETNASLFAAWILSNDSSLEGPEFGEILEQDPEGYCLGLKILLQIHYPNPWESSLVGLLVQVWSTDSPLCSVIKEQLVEWLLHTRELGEAGSNASQFWNSYRVQKTAIRIVGHRYDPEFIGIFCKSLSLFSSPQGRDEDLYDWLIGDLGFMLRWSYQERALLPLSELASNSKEVEAAKTLAFALRQVGLPDVLRRESKVEPGPSVQPLNERFKRGQLSLLGNISAEEFVSRAPHQSAGELAGDWETHELDPEAQEVLITGLSALIGTGKVKSNKITQDNADRIFDAWIPWVARSVPQSWWEIIVELAEQLLATPTAYWALRRFPILGVWARQGNITPMVEQGLAEATGPAWETLRSKPEIRQLLRWALHMEDKEALLRCLQMLARDKKLVETALTYPIPWVMRWALDRSTFDKASEQRRKATSGVERELWFLVEHSFVVRLPVEEALSWCREVVPLAVKSDILHRILFDTIIHIDDPGALDLLLGEENVADLKGWDAKEKTLGLAIWLGEVERLAASYPDFVRNLDPINKGTFLFEAGRTEEFRRWGHDLLSRPLQRTSSVQAGLPFNRNRRTLHRWAHLEHDAFLAAVERIFASQHIGRLHEHANFLEALLLVWQDLDPLSAAKARTRYYNGVPFRRNWSQNRAPIHIDTLWDPEFSTRPEHRSLRLQWLRSCPSDKDIALHAWAARKNGMLREVGAIGVQLLSMNRQLERALGVSLLAWHPDGDGWLEVLVNSDPSQWVREHAEWAIGVCRRDRLGRRICREALEADDWIEQQAKFETLIPLILPTFFFWLAWDEEILELVETLTPRRRALLVDFRYYVDRREARWDNVLGRNLEKFCRGENISFHLEVGEKGPPWL